jgi:NADPH2:quinone reductase
MKQRIIVEEYGGPEVMKVASVEAPEPAEDEVLVRLMASGVNPVDTYRRAGSQGYNPPLPFTPGFEAAGSVAKTGAKVSGFPEGTRVYIGWSINGTYGEWCLAKPEQLYVLPDGIDYIQGAALFVNYFTAYRALFLRGDAKPGDRVFIHGASGGVGLAAAQLCRQFGLHFSGTAGSKGGIELVESEGAALVLNHHEEDHMETMDEGSFDLILEMRADLYLEKDVSKLKDGGRVMVIGSRGTTQFAPRGIMGKEADVRGVVLFKNTFEEGQKIHDDLVRGIEAGIIRPHIQQEFPLVHASEAHRVLMEAPSLGKIILIP